MNLAEYLKVKDFTYEQYCAYLKDKYGTVPFAYGNKGNRDRDDTKGLFIHHIAEDRVAALSQPEQRKNYPEYQKSDMLVYCDYLEHVLLHLMIGAETAAVKNLGLDGPQRFIIPALRNYFNFGIKHPKWNDTYYNLIKNDKDVFIKLFKDYNNLIENIDTVLDTNIVLYEQMYEMLETKNKALVVLGTGLGKTSTALQYIRDKHCRALVIGPNNTIKGQRSDIDNEGNGWLKNPDVDATTYQAFVNKYDSTDYSKYGLVILDEAHHAGFEEDKDIGAIVWGKAIQYLFDNSIKVLGLTATPIRSDGIDISETIFKDCTCEGYTIEEAIELGIIHPFSFITSIYDTAGIKDKIKAIANKVDLGDPHTKKLVGHLNLTINNIPTVNETLHTFIDKTNVRRKGIVFVQSIDSEDRNNVKSAEAIIKQAYPLAKIRSIHSEQTEDEINANRQWFIGDEDSDKDKYLIAVNMISEGAHYPGVNTIIMFRTTQSYLVYSQQLGRAITLAKYADPHTIVFDFVNNIENIQYNSRKVKDNKDKGPRKKSKKTKDLLEALMTTYEYSSGQIIVKNEARDFVKSMKELKEYCDNSWSDEELAIVGAKNFIKSGASYFKECQKKIDYWWLSLHPGSLNSNMHHRSIASISDCYFKKLGLKTDHKYTQENIQFIINNYIAKGSEFCARKIGVSVESIQSLANKRLHLYRNLNLVQCIRHTHTDEQKQAIITRYPTEGLDLIKDPLFAGFTKKALKHFAKSCGVKSQRKPGCALMKRVLCVETGIVYESAKEAERIMCKLLGCKRVHIKEVVNNPNRTAGGYHWKYVD